MASNVSSKWCVTFESINFIISSIFILNAVVNLEKRPLFIQSSELVDNVGGLPIVPPAERLNFHVAAWSATAVCSKLNLLSTMRQRKRQELELRLQPVHELAYIVHC